MGKALIALAAAGLAATGGAKTMAGILYPDLEVARLPFNNPGTV